MSSLENLIFEVNELINSGKFEEALPLFEKIITIDPGNIEMLYLFAMTKIELERFDAAESLLQKALTVDMDNTDCLLQLGYLNHRKHHIPESKELFSKILKIDPNHSDALQMLGMIAMEEEDYQQAIEFLEVSQKTKKDNDNLLKIIECHLQLETSDPAKSLLDSIDETELSQDQNQLFQNLKTWYYLDKTVENWSGTGIDENGEEGLFPVSMDEILESEIYLLMAKKLTCNDKFLLEQRKQIEEVVATNRQKISRFSIEANKTLANAFLISLICIVVLVIIFSINYKIPSPTDFNEKNFVVRSRTELLFTNLSEFEKNPKNYRKPVPLGTQLKPIAFCNDFSVQVENPTGDRGFVEAKRLTGVEKAFVLDQVPLYKNLNSDTIATYLEKDQTVTIESLRKVKITNGNYRYYAEAATATGDTGFVAYDNLIPAFLNNLPKINPTLSFPVSYKYIQQKIIGSTLQEIENKYGPARSIMSVSYKKIACFEQINFIKNRQRQTGIIFILDDYNTITDCMTYKSGKLKFIDHLPLNRIFRKWNLLKPLRLKFYKIDNHFFNWLNNFSKKNGFTQFIGKLIRLIILFPLILLFLYFPRLILNPVILLLENYNKINPKILRYISSGILIFGTYFFFIWMVFLFG